MADVRRFGTDVVTGLNVGTAEHKIADHELTVSQGGWTDRDGVWRTAESHYTVHSGSAISAFAIGRMGGQDHNVYMDGNTLYDTGSSVGTIAAGSKMRIFQLDDKFLVLGCTDGKNRIYDGDHVRQQGTWQADDLGDTGAYLGDGYDWTAGTITYTAISQANPCSIAAATHGLSTGDHVYITGETGMTELNGRIFTVTVTDANNFTIGEDTSGYTAANLDATIYDNACGLLAGDYQWYLVPTLELTSGEILLGRPRGLRRFVDHPGQEDDYTTWDARTFSITGPADQVLVSFSINFDDSNFVISGTKGTDYYPGVRLYRTKKDSPGNLYLEKTWRHGDSDFTYSSGWYTPAAPGYYSVTPDADLGALLTYGLNDHDAPPQSMLAAQVGQRAYINDESNPNRIYISDLDGTEYFNDSEFVKIPDTVTALHEMRDHLIVFSAARMWALDMISGFPYLREIDTPVGTIFPDALCSSDEGLFFVKNHAVYHFDGVRVEKISRRGAEDIDLDDGQAASVSNDTAIFITTDGSSMARIRDGGWTWHQAYQSLNHTHLAQNSRGEIYGALPTKIEKLFAGSTYAGTLVSKVFGDGKSRRAHKLYVDIQPATGASANAQILSNTYTGAVHSLGLSGTSRQIVEVSLERDRAEQFRVRLVCTGDVQIFGYWIDTEDRV